MAVESNGKLPEPGQKAMNGHAIAPRSKTAKKRKGSSLFSFISRYIELQSMVENYANTNLSLDFSPGTQ